MFLQDKQCKLMYNILIMGDMSEIVSGAVVNDNIVVNVITVTLCQHKRTAPNFFWKSTNYYYTIKNPQIAELTGTTRI